jgi:hypothetical protein
MDVFWKLLVLVFPRCGSSEWLRILSFLKRIRSLQVWLFYLVRKLSEQSLTANLDPRGTCAVPLSFRAKTTQSTELTGKPCRYQMQSVLLEQERTSKRPKMLRTHLQSMQAESGEDDNYDYQANKIVESAKPLRRLYNTSVD